MERQSIRSGVCKGVQILSHGDQKEDKEMDQDPKDPFKDTLQGCNFLPLDLRL